jgi:putative NADH-flavin reductase
MKVAILDASGSVGRKLIDHALVAAIQPSRYGDPDKTRT